MKYQQSRHFGARSAISVLLSFLLSLFISVLSVVTAFYATAMNAGYLANRIDSSGYSGYLLEEIEDNLVSYGLASGFEEAFFETVVDEPQVKADVLKQAELMYEGKTDGFETAAFADTLYKKLLLHIEEQGLTLTEENDQAVKHLAEECAKVYGESVSFPAASQFSNILQKLKTPMLIALIGDLCLLIFTAGFLFVLYRRKYKFFQYTVYALSGSVLLIGIPSLFILLSGRLERLGIVNQALYTLLIGYLRGILQLLLAIAGVLLVLAVICFMIYVTKRKRFIKECHDEYRKN